MQPQSRLVRPPQPQPQGFALNFLMLEGFVLNPVAFIALDLTGYLDGNEPPNPKTDEEGRLAEGREIVLHLAGEVDHTFENERADRVWNWFLISTGQAKIES